MVLIVLLSFYSLINVPYLYLPEGARINFGDYLIGELNMIQLIMFIAYPSIFSFLVLNIIRGDFEDNYIDDVGYCNDRSIGTKGGWNPNGGSGFLYFSHCATVWNCTPSM